MLPLEVQQHIQRIDAKVRIIGETIAVINERCNASDSLKMQTIASNFLVIATAGLVEKSVQSILYSFCSKRGNKKIQQYIEFHLGRETTMNCEKIASLLGKFDVSWGKNFCSQITEEQEEAIDRIKGLRDKLAHGDHDGTNLSIIQDYYKHTKKALEVLSSIVT